MLPTPPPRLESFNVVLRETVSGASTTTPLSQLKKIKKQDAKIIIYYFFHTKLKSYNNFLIL